MGFLNGGVVRFAKLRGTDAGRQQFTRRIAFFTGFRQRNLRVGAKGQTVFFTAEAIAELP
ncbi:hypothetical protein BN1221_00943c [Brenneria goodwinii]|uniref:Uncharacterized protein n=1 Tax=Brenneria goodwinii TaxID=1109412 RepID=A0A0G4JRM1_9GAMM|nr:hypothetical protein BN1221_00943c [Brenneria goodwinii]